MVRPFVMLDKRIRDASTDLWVLRYGAALIATLFALLLRFALVPVIGDRRPFVMFWFSVVFSALYGGVGAGLFATALSAALTAMVFLGPWSSLASFDNPQFVNLWLFVVQGVIISLLVGMLRAAYCAAEQARTQREQAERWLRVQYRIGNEIAEGRSFDATLPQVFEVLIDEVGWDVVQWWRVEHGILRYATGRRNSRFPAEDFAAFEEACQHIQVVEGSGVLGGVWQGAEARCLEHLVPEQREEYASAAVTRGIRSICALPVVAGTEVIGVVVALGVDPEPMVDASALPLHALGSQLGQFCERDRAAAQARLSQHRQSAILAAALDAIVMIDHEGIVREWNDAAEAMFGYERAQAIGATMASLIVPAHMREAHRRGMAHHLATGNTTMLGTCVEFDAMRSDGTIFPIELVIVRLPTDGLPLFTGFIRDLAQRKQRETVLHFQAQLLDSVEEAIVATDTDGTITYWNRYAETLYGWRAVDVVGRNAFEVLVPARGRNRAISILEHLQTGKSWSGMWRMQRRDGTTFPAMLTAAPLYYRRGELIGLVSIGRDISSFRHLKTPDHMVVD